MVVKNKIIAVVFFSTLACCRTLGAMETLTDDVMVRSEILGGVDLKSVGQHQATYPGRSDDFSIDLENVYKKGTFCCCIPTSKFDERSYVYEVGSAGRRGSRPAVDRLVMICDARLGEKLPISIVNPSGKQETHLIKMDAAFQRLATTVWRDVLSSGNAYAMFCTTKLPKLHTGKEIATCILSASNHNDIDAMQYLSTHYKMSGDVPRSTAELRVAAGKPISFLMEFINVSEHPESYAILSSEYTKTSLDSTLVSEYPSAHTALEMQRQECFVAEERLLREFISAKERLNTPGTAEYKLNKQRREHEEWRTYKSRYSAASHKFVKDYRANPSYSSYEEVYTPGSWDPPLVITGQRYDTPPPPSPKTLIGPGPAFPDPGPVSERLEKRLVMLDQ
jgi:hypothetical protein